MSAERRALAVDDASAEETAAIAAALTLLGARSAPGDDGAERPSRWRLAGRRYDAYDDARRDARAPF